MFWRFWILLLSGWLLLQLDGLSSYVEIHEQLRIGMSILKNLAAIKAI